MPGFGILHNSTLAKNLTNFDPQKLNNLTDIIAPTGDPYGVHVVSSSVFTVKKMFPDEQMRHSIKDMNIVSHGRFPILRPKLKKIWNIKIRIRILINSSVNIADCSNGTAEKTVSR